MYNARWPCYCFMLLPAIPPTLPYALDMSNRVQACGVAPGSGSLVPARSTKRSHPRATPAHARLLSFHQASPCISFPCTSKLRKEEGDGEGVGERCSAGRCAAPALAQLCVAEQLFPGCSWERTSLTVSVGGFLGFRISRVPCGMTAAAQQQRPSPAVRQQGGHRPAQAPPGTASWSSRSRQELLHLLAAESELAIKHVSEKDPRAGA